jgi:sugar/nucleoside kinase (ribokinase family)
VPRLAVIGNVSRDRVGGDPPRAGGGVYYAAQALAALGAEAVILARCDAELATEVEQLGPHVSVLQAREATAFSFDYLGEHRRMTVDAVGDSWTPEDVALLSAVDDVRWVLVAGLLRSHFPLETLAALGAGGRRLLADGQGLARVAAPGPLVLDREIDPAVYAELTALKLNEEEATVLAGGTGDEELRALGVPEVILTLGSRGARVVTADAAAAVPAHPAGAVADPTGAGDTFAAAYLSARSQGAPPRQAAERAAEEVARFLAGR